MIYQKKGLSILLMAFCMALFIALMPFTAYPATPSDTDTHWAKNVISKWIDQGLASGYSDGTFKPDEPVSRAEFMALVNNAFGYQASTAINYIDVPKGAWYEGVVAKAKAAGYIAGYPDGTIKPDAPVTRQEAAAIIARIKILENNPAGSSVFADATDIPDWCKGSIGAVAKAAYMNGYPDGFFKPQNSVTRAEAITALDKTASITDTSETKDNQLIFDKAGTYGPEKTIEDVKTDVIIKADGVTVQNQKIHGDLIIAEEVGQGTVTLNNVIVEGNTYVRGGGPDSIVINGGQYKNIIIQNVDGKVRVVAKGVKGRDGKAVDIVVAEEAGGNEVILNGEFNSVLVEANNMVVSTQGDTSIATLTVAKNVSGTKLNINQGTDVKDLILHSKAEVKGAGNIQNKTEPPSTPSGGGGGGGGSSNKPSNKDPKQPETPAPANGAEKVKLLPFLNWSCSDPDGDALTYDIYFGTDQTQVENLNQSVKKETGHYSTTYLPGQLDSLTTYYWRIVAKDEKGGQAVGPLWRFTTKEPEVITDSQGYFKIENEDKSKLIEGYVTHNRGGAGISGATVTYPADIFQTPGDILVSINELAAARIQDVYWKSVSGSVYGEESVSSQVYGGGGSVIEYVYGWNNLDYIYEVPVRDLFNTSWGETPPDMQLEGISPGATLSGTVDFDLSFQSETGIYVYYVYLGGEQRHPKEDYDLGEWGENSVKVSIDTTTYPNGPTYLKILAYDNNENSVLYVLPVTVQNEVNPEQQGPPGQIKELNLTCETYGKNWGLYSMPVDQTKTMDNDSWNEDDVTIINELSWDSATGADGYKVYRSFDGVKYKQIGTVKTVTDDWVMNKYVDTSYELAIGKLTYYKVVPYNSRGDNSDDALIRCGAPLPGFNIILDSPRNGETGVELSPTFSWYVQTIGGSFEDYQSKYKIEDSDQWYEFQLYDATDYLKWKDSLFEEVSEGKNKLEYELPFDLYLEPGGIYSWDIINGEYYVEHEDTDNGYSESVSYAGDGLTGSINGENMFTTTIDNEVGDNISQTDLLDFENSRFADGHILVKTNNTAGLAKTLELLGSECLKEWDETGWSMVKVPRGQDVKSFIRQLLKDPNVVIAQPDYLLDRPEPVKADDSQKLLTQAVSASVNTIVGPEVAMDKLWGLKNIYAEEAWQKNTGSSDVILAILDTGVQTDHPEFADKSFVSPYDATGEGTPNIDLGGHGTHVAGIAGDNGRSGEIAGVAWDCPIMPIRVQDSYGVMYTSYWIEAVSYVTKYVEENPDKRVVINMSLGGRGYDFASKDAIDKALEKGVVVVTSTGNHSKRVSAYPAAYNGVIAVAASTPKNTRTDFSTTGPWISVAAPGIKIYSTYYNYFYGSEYAYKFSDGTSMASPYVAGAAALLLSEYPELTPAQVKNQLEKTAQGNGFTEELGYGVIDMEAMLREIQPVDYGSLKVTTNIKQSESVIGVGYGVLSLLDRDENLVGYGTTGEDGGHTFHYLKPGEYKVVLSYYNKYEEEYQQEVVEDVTILSRQTAELEFNLEAPSRIEMEEMYTEDIVLTPDEQPYRYDFTVTEQDEGYYEFETSFFAGDEDEYVDTELYLWDGDGNLIEYNDNYSDEYSFIGTYLYAGDYTVEIKEYFEDDLYCTFEIRKFKAFYED
ncbi:S-layer homology domain-containing protein [Desulfotomaculum arcticum]|uniref:S-layer homology domain-containing protein n=1 Tax=Desulfotruncus arcticus DSM 17038 TaxID=1121424 RepID=A0A1I2XF86_9FIRM|nr:S8 family serine peptidase [Desulfotruncus arcticus]SFH12095.1 S-layer homology domain-containing protein [Desulfotomaculum arcticum] [Desulfotruncus arcticus DSM 17038]